MITILKNLFFVLVLSAFVYSCTNSPATENTKTENTTVNKETSQQAATTEKPIDTTSPEEDGQSDTPNPLTPSGEAVVANSDIPHIATAPQPSPERTNVSPAKEVASKTVNPPATPVTKVNSNPPATRTQTGAAENPDSPRPVVEKSEEKKEDATPSPPISSDKKERNVKPQNPPSLSHQAFDELLKKYVSASGKVNYAGIKNEKANLEGYLNLLKSNPPQTNWPRNKKMAFWINAYNAFTIKLIVDNYPISSITKLDGGKPWDRKWINIGERTYSLNNIENDILRPRYKDARIHFAVNCAAKSCPPLLNRAWTANNLNSNFEKQAKAFINNQNFNKISSGKVQVSKIFEWYAVDFGNLIEFLNRYSNIKINSNAKVEYLKYNWDLNE